MTAVLPPRAQSSGPLDRWWFAICALTLVVTTEYKWRIRSHDESLGGALDLQIIVELAGYALVAFYLLERRSPVPRARPTHAAIWLLAVYTVYTALSAAWSPYAATGAARGAETFVVLGLTWTMSQVVDRAQVHRFCHAFIALTTGSVLVGILWPLPAPWSDRERFSWLLVHPNTSAVFMSIAFVLAWIYVVGTRLDTGGVRWPRPVHALCLVLLAQGLLANHSRGSVVAAAAGILVATSLVRPVALRFVALTAVMAVTASGLVMFWGRVVEYAARGESADQLASLNGRYSLWAVALESVRDNPLFGSGVYASRGIFFDETGLGGGHNAFINVMVDLGVVGTVLLVLVVVYTAGTLWRMHVTTADGRMLIDRTIIVSVLALLVVNGATTAGIGAVGNVSSIFLYVLVGWTALLVRTRPWSTPSGAVTASRQVVSR